MTIMIHKFGLPSQLDSGLFSRAMSLIKGVALSKFLTAVSRRLQKEYEYRFRRMSMIKIEEQTITI